MRSNTFPCLLLPLAINRSKSNQINTQARERRLRPLPIDSAARRVQFHLGVRVLSHHHYPIAIIDLFLKKATFHSTTPPPPSHTHFPHFLALYFSLLISTPPFSLYVSVCVCVSLSFCSCFSLHLSLSHSQARTHPSRPPRYARTSPPPPPHHTTLSLSLSHTHTHIHTQTPRNTNTDRQTD